MADFPIIFSAPMVRALFAGRKTMTRRLLYTRRKVKNGKVNATMLQGYEPGSGRLTPEGFPDDHGPDEFFTLTGWHKAKPGDRLWVRENLVRGAANVARYNVDHGQVWSPAGPTGGVAPWRWQKPNLNSIHMPRWASRLTLELTATRIERLQDIREADAIAEGVKPEPFPGDGWAPNKAAFAGLWMQLHGQSSWYHNPWVVRLTFKVHHTNIDAMEKAA